MRYIDCFVSDEYVKGAGVPVGAAGSHHDVSIRFSFGSMWDGLTKSITWLNAKGQNPTITYITEDLRVAGAEVPTYVVTIPAEPKEFKGNMSCSIKGAKITGNKEDLATLAVTCEFKILESKYDKNAVAEKSPNATIADQIQHQFTQIADQLENTTIAANGAMSARDQAYDSAELALQYKNEADQHSRDASQTSVRVQEYARNARDYSGQAEAAKNTAVSKAAEAEVSAQTATEQAAIATEQANIAEENAGIAVSAKNDAYKHWQNTMISASAASRSATSAANAEKNAKNSADDAAYRARESAMNLTASAQAKTAAEQAKDEAAESATLAYNHSVLTNSYARQAEEASEAASAYMGSAYEASASAMQSAHEAANTLSSKVSKYTYRYDGGTELKTGSGVVVIGSEFKNILSRITSNENVTVLMYAGMMIAKPTSATNSVIVFTDAFYDAGASTNKRASLVVNYVDDRSPVQCSIVTSNMEVSSNKVNIISDANKDSKTFYPSVKAMAGYVDPIAEKVTGVESSVGELKQDKADKSEVELLRKKNAEQDYEIEVLKAVTKGIDWIEHEDSTEAMVKTVPSGAEGVQIDSIGAKSVVWNQMLNPNTWKDAARMNGATFDSGSLIGHKNGITFEINVENGTVTLNGTASANTAIYLADRFSKSKYQNHVTYLCGSPKDASESTYYLCDGNGSQYDYGDGFFGTFLTTLAYAFYQIYVKSGITCNNVVFRPRMGDMTAMFGITSNADIAEWMKVFIKSYAEPHPGYNSGEIVGGVIDFVVNSKDGSVTDFTELVSKYFPNGMHGVGPGFDHFDFERMKAVQTVGGLNLGVQSWSYNNTASTFSFSPNGLFVAIRAASFLCAKYLNSGTSTLSDMANYTAQIFDGTRIVFKNTQFSNKSDFIADLDGVMFYARLATPIETDLDPADVPMLKMLVEAGGTLTFNNDALLDIPNKVTYAVKTGGVA